jgi:pimeloyl-ACP methyl ester carboxylesterase
MRADLRVPLVAVAFSLTGLAGCSAPPEPRTASAIARADGAGGEVARSVIADPPADAANPASMDAFVMTSHDGAMNAVMYVASGAGPHPTLLLLHGFPGNEQNLDLAQAARRAGWSVLTLHYRGSWGSPGAFSFAGAAEDAHVALAFLRAPATVAKYRIDPARIAVAGHSMGGFMAADAAADDPAVIGLFLIDAWNIAGTAASLGAPAALAGWRQEAASDLPPLAGTSVDALTAEMKNGGQRFDVTRRIAAYGDRPLLVIGAERGVGAENRAFMATARESRNRHVSGEVWPTDHSFSDRRIALASALVTWLGGLQAAR